MRILTGSGRLDDFKRNPQQFIELAAEVINRTQAPGARGRHQVPAPRRRALLRPGTLRAGGADRLPQEHAGRDQVRLRAVIYDSSGVERTFAEQLEKNEAVKVYAKLPGWFKVPTPLGTYNPDWAVLVEKDGAERLYFVVETKSSLFTDDLRDKESAKIECGKAHFKALAVGERPCRIRPGQKHRRPDGEVLSGLPPEVILHQPAKLAAGLLHLVGARPRVWS